MDQFKRRNFLGHLGAFAGGALVSPGLLAADNAQAADFESVQSDLVPDKMKSGIAQGFSVVIYLDQGRVHAVNRKGKIIAEGEAGKDDSRVFREAVNATAPNGGEIRITSGRYRFSETVLVDLPVTLSGEGKNTILVPPADDYLFKVTTSKRSPLRPNSDGLIEGKPGDDTLYGVTVQMLTVDGEGAGKGFFLTRLFDCLFQNLWMHDIRRGSAFHLDYIVMESNFINIHLNSTGCKETGAASIHLSGNTNNNLHFNRVFTIFPEARGLQVNGGTIIYFNDCMWHGQFPYDKNLGRRLLPNEWPRDYNASNIILETEELIYVEEIGYDKGLTIARSRITNNHPDYSHVVVKKGEVAIIDGIIGGGAGADAMIRAEKEARMRISGNHIEGFPNFTPQVLQCNGGEVVFRDNVVAGRNKCVKLNAAKRSLISGNRFTGTTKGASLQVFDHEGTGCEHIIISDNIFQEEKADAAIEFGKLSQQGATLGNNSFAGKYSGDPVI